MKIENIHYQVRFPEPHRHVYEVTLRVTKPGPNQRFQMASWIPGSYLIREFVKQVHCVSAHQGKKRRPIEMKGKDLWEVKSDGLAPIEIRYRVMAHDDSVRTAWLDAQRGFFNGTSLFMQVVAQQNEAVSLDIEPPKTLSHWRLATAMTAIKTNTHGFGLYRASNFDELVDHPVEMGEFWSEFFDLRGIPHRLVVTGASPNLDTKRLLADTQKICETTMRFWHGRGKPDFDRYVFLLNALPKGYGGLEHRNSTALLTQHSDLPRQNSTNDHDGYLRLLGLISHEYFHTWNVKRLKPATFTPYQYQCENLTELLWFFEGFTSYYDDLLLKRAGLLSTHQYLQRLQKTMSQVAQTPGRKKHTLAQSSLEAWTKYYRADAQSQNLTVSYYTKGSLVALCWDLTLRNEGKCLDDVMRLLWKKTKGGPMNEADWLAALSHVRGRSGEQEHQSWVHETDELPVQTLLAQHGVRVQAQTATWSERLGLSVQSQSGAGLLITQVLEGSWASQSGFAPGDEWVAIGIASNSRSGFSGSWRLHNLDDLDVYAVPNRPLKAWVFRRRQGHELRLPALPSSIQKNLEQLSVADEGLVASWLGSV